MIPCCIVLRVTGMWRVAVLARQVIRNSIWAVFWSPKLLNEWMHMLIYMLLSRIQRTDTVHTLFQDDMNRSVNCEQEPPSWHKSGARLRHRKRYRDRRKRDTHRNKVYNAIVKRKRAKLKSINEIQATWRNNKDGVFWVFLGESPMSKDFRLLIRNGLLQAHTKKSMHYNPSTARFAKQCSGANENESNEQMTNAKSIKMAMANIDFVVKSRTSKKKVRRFLPKVY